MMPKINKAKIGTIVPVYKTVKKPANAVEMSFRALTDSLAPLADIVPGPFVIVKPNRYLNSLNS